VAPNHILKGGGQVKSYTDHHPRLENKNVEGKAPHTPHACIQHSKVPLYFFIIHDVTFSTTIDNHT